MKGSIITNQRCTVCNDPLVHDEKRHGCFCKKHPHVEATRFIVRFPGRIFQRHKSYESASQALNYLRYEKGNREDRFNPDDYRAIKPNSFNALKDKYLARKKDRATYRKIESYINRAADHFKLTNIREINGADIEDYLYSIPRISEKTRFNHMTQLRDFWKWCLARGNIITLAEMPTFPEIEYTLGYRKITDWDTQEKVIKKVMEISYHINPKIWLGIDMLATYTSLRPDDLRRVSESSLDSNGWLVIHNPTKRKNKFKTIHLHEDHVKVWRELQRRYPALPDITFFRHVPGISGCVANEKFGDKYLYKWWIKACNQVGLKGVPLYPGTKHTTATETAKMLGTDKARSVSGLTNKAFDRYCQIENDGSFEVIKAILKRKKKADVIPLKKKKNETE
jgi:hypothetical protein